MDGKTVLVTGGSRGIGLELARQFAQAGYDPILVARSEEELSTASRGISQQFPVNSTFIATDLTRPDAPEKLYALLAKQERRVTVLVNNAGVGSIGRFVDQHPDRQLEMMRLNIECLVTLTRLFLPGMIHCGAGGVLNVASTAAFQPGPLMAVYYASKAFVLSFSEALSREIGNRGPRVTVLCPGPTRSRFHESARMDTTRLIGRLSMMSPQSVARAGYQGFRAGKRVVVPGVINKVTVLWARLAPRKLTITAVHLLNRNRIRSDD